MSLKKIKSAVVVFPGTNCDRDTKRALDFMGMNAEFISHNDTNLNPYDFIFLPGGFSYGDYIRSGRLAKLSPVINSLKEYINCQRGVAAGICNGFQILCEAGILKGVLTDNVSLKFICKSQKLVLNGKRNIILPVAHKEGRYLADDSTIDYLNENNMIFLKYTDNPNGSDFDIAGIYDNKKRVFGMMPHPERAVFKETGLTDGILIFEIIKKEL